MGKWGFFGLGRALNGLKRADFGLKIFAKNGQKWSNFCKNGLKW